MPRPHHLIIVGAVFLTIGALLLALGGAVEGFIILFPFIGIFSPETSMGLVGLLFGVLTLMFVLSLLRGSPDNRLIENPSQTYIRVVQKCRECGRPIPEKGIFCAYCGSPVSSPDSDNYFE